MNQSRISAKELDAQSDISLFRDHLRVLPYGEPGNDWLFLDQERIQDPSGRIGNNQVIGLIPELASGGRPFASAHLGPLHGGNPSAGLRNSD